LRPHSIIRIAILEDGGKKNMNTHRAGNYANQIGGYKAFVPKPLPPDPPVQLDQEMVHLLSLAERSLGRLDGASGILPNVDLFVAMYVNKEAVLSSQIEGTQASLIDVLAFEADAVAPDNPQDIEEVVNYINALNYGLQRLNTLPLSLRLIREIHALLLSGVRGANRKPGEFRTSQNWIGDSGPITSAKFVPPSPRDMNSALGDLENFFHSKGPLPVLLKIGLIHAQFETIHPFLDGNGRMGRLLITFLLCHEEVLSRPLLYLSTFFKLHRADYYRYLQKVRDEGDWESWLKFFLQGIVEVAKEATDTARSIVQLRENHRDIISKHISRSAGSAYQLLEYLYQRPIITANSVARVTGLTYANANHLITKFRENGLLHQMDKYQRNRRFVYSSYLALFADDQVLKDEHQTSSEAYEEETRN
jgi:Fic family protein